MHQIGSEADVRCTPHAKTAQRAFLPLADGGIHYLRIGPAIVHGGPDDRPTVSRHDMTGIQWSSSPPF